MLSDVHTIVIVLTACAVILLKKHKKWHVHGAANGTKGSFRDSSEGGDRGEKRKPVAMLEATRSLLSAVFWSGAGLLGVQGIKLLGSKSGLMTGQSAHTSRA